MAEMTKKMTRKEKIAAGIEKGPKKKRQHAEMLREFREEQASAMLRNNPISPRKMRMVVDLVRGMEVDHALNVLKFTPKAGAPYVRKLLLSAIANWEEKNKSQRIEDSGLFIREGFVNASRTLKRFRPAPQGRAHRIRKRSCHVTLVLDTIEDIE